MADNDATKHFNAANQAFVDEDFSFAIECYSSAIKCSSSNANYYFKRCNAYMMVENLADALADVEKSISIFGEDARVHYKHGLILNQLEKYNEALTAFRKAALLKPDNKQYMESIKSCEIKVQESPSSTLKSTEKEETEEKENDTHNLPSKPKIKYDWYQTDTHVVLTVLIKNLKPENLEVAFTETTLSFTAKLSADDSYCLELDLAHNISAADSSYKILSTKVEVKLKKSEGIRWSSLETDNESQFVNAVNVNQPSEDAVHKYPTSSHVYKDWDRLAKQIQEEEKTENMEGDAALNKLFQQIYSDGTDEVKKAMNKSFQESGGTVLSTNWRDVKKDTVEVKPPDCMEYKKYEY